MAISKIVRTRTLGFHRNNKRLWLSPRIISDAGLKGGDVIYFDFKNNSKTPTLSISSEATQTSVQGKVSDTARGGVIDINNKTLTNNFRDYEEVQLITNNGVIEVVGSHAESLIHEREETFKRRVKTRQPLRKGGCYVGTGLLCRSVHRGINKAGVSVKQRFANEYAELPSEVNMGGNEIWEDACDDAIFTHHDIYTMDMNLVPKLDILVMGNPCPAFSQANTTMKKEGKVDIFHPESGTIFQPTLSLIRAGNPAVIVLENSKFLKDSIFDYIMSDVMDRFGYKSVDTIVTGRDFGAFEKRERLCRVWISKGLDLPDVSKLVDYHKKNTRTVADVLEPIDLDSPNWARRRYLEQKDAQEHNGHTYFIVDEDDRELPIMGANYHKIQADSPFILHPHKELVTRIFTPSEHCNTRHIYGRLKAEIVAVANGDHPAKKSTRSNVSAAHKMLGNSVNPEPWEAVGEWLGSWALSLVGGEAHTPNNPSLNVGDQLGLLFVA